jgi:hypothetical protein
MLVKLLLLLLLHHAVGAQQEPVFIEDFLTGIPWYNNV